MAITDVDVPAETDATMASAPRLVRASLDGERARSCHLCVSLPENDEPYRAYRLNRTVAAPKELRRQSCVVLVIERIEAAAPSE